MTQHMPAHTPCPGKQRPLGSACFIQPFAAVQLLRDAGCCMNGCLSAEHLPEQGESPQNAACQACPHKMVLGAGLGITRNEQKSQPQMRGCSALTRQAGDQNGGRWRSQVVHWGLTRQCVAGCGAAVCVCRGPWGTEGRLGV